MFTYEEFIIKWKAHFFHMYLRTCSFVLCDFVLVEAEPSVKKVEELLVSSVGL